MKCSTANKDIYEIRNYASTNVHNEILLHVCDFLLSLLPPPQTQLIYKDVLNFPKSCSSPDMSRRRPINFSPRSLCFPREVILPIVESKNEFEWRKKYRLNGIFLLWEYSFFACNMLKDSRFINAFGRMEVERIRTARNKNFLFHIQIISNGIFQSESSWSELYMHTFAFVR